MNVTNLVTAATDSLKAFTHSAKFVKYAPKILLGVGVTTIVGGTVVACKQTLKVEEIIDDHQNSVEQIHDIRNEAIESGDEEELYSEKDMKKDLLKVYARTSGRIAKNYTVPTVMILFGIGCVGLSNGILNSNYIKAVAAYETLMIAYKDRGRAFEEYRKRVIEDFGPEKDELYRYGFEKKEEIVETTTKKGTVKKKIETHLERRPNGASEFAVIFGPDYSTNAIRPKDYAGDGYSRNTIRAIREQNLQFLLNTQAACNERLRREGHLFLNDVYRMLGMQFPTNEGGYTSDRACGAINGWIWSEDEEGNYNGPGDGYVDFGIYDFGEIHDNSAFVSGFEDNIWLDFNCDGVMYDLIGDFREPKPKFLRKRFSRVSE